MLTFHIAQVSIGLDLLRLLILLACVVVAFVVGMSLVRAYSKRRTLPMLYAMPPFAVLSFVTQLPPESVSEAIARYAPAAGMSVISRQGADFLVLSEPTSVVRVGRYYPISLRDCPGVGTRVEVGMLSQLTQAPLVASKRLRRHVAGILNALDTRYESTQQRSLVQ